VRTLYLLSVWLHVLSAAVWIGGMIFLVAVLLPVMRRPEYRGLMAPLIHWTGLRFRLVGWICLGTLVLSGTINLIYRGVTWASLGSVAFWFGPFGRTLGIKLLLVAVILSISALHDFYLGPRATALWQADPAAPEARRLRRQASWIGRGNLLLALVVAALGVMLVRGWP
jgi:copper resistance protein D